MKTPEPRCAKTDSPLGAVWGSVKIDMPPTCAAFLDKETRAELTERCSAVVNARLSFEAWLDVLGIVENWLGIE